MDALLTIEHDRTWLVVIIERKRRIRRFYLSPSEATELAAKLTRELPKVTTSRTG
jgi:hypothetical protein